MSFSSVDHLYFDTLPGKIKIFENIHPVFVYFSIEHWLWVPIKLILNVDNFSKHVNNKIEGLRVTGYL